MEKVDNIFRPEYEKYIPILKNTKKDKVPTKRLPNEPWQIKGFGSKFAFLMPAVPNQNGQTSASS